MTRGYKGVYRGADETELIEGVETFLRTITDLGPRDNISPQQLKDPVDALVECVNDWKRKQQAQTFAQRLDETGRLDSSRMQAALKVISKEVPDKDADAEVESLGHPSTPHGSKRVSSEELERTTTMRRIQ